MNSQESFGDHEPPEHVTPQPIDNTKQPSNNVGYVLIDMVMPDPDQPRKQFSEESLDRLAQSMRDKGQLTPIRVRWSEQFGKWLITAGERRWKAARKAGHDSITCVFHEGELSFADALEEALVDNLHREDLQPIDEARAFAKLMEFNGWTGKQLADALQLAPSTVTRALALLKLPEDVQEKIIAGDIAPRTAYELSKLNDSKGQRDLGRQASAGTLTHTKAARAVRQRKGRRRSTKGTRLTFPCEGGIKINVASARTVKYLEIEQALEQTLDEVRLRVKNRVQII